MTILILDVIPDRLRVLFKNAVFTTSPIATLPSLFSARLPCDLLPMVARNTGASSMWSQACLLVTLEALLFQGM